MGASNTAPCQQQDAAATADYIVEPDWLALQQRCPDLRILDVRERASYAVAHLPGAVWLDRNSLSNTHRDHSVTLLPGALFARLAGRLGIDAATTVVVYDDVRGLHAARVVWALRRYGHPRALVLNGGVECWHATGYAVTTGVCLAYPRVFIPNPDQAQWASLGWLATHSSDRALLLLDVRTEHEYAEAHLPNARHWAWDNGAPMSGWALRRPPGELRAELLRQGITPDRRIVTYCSSGMRAAHTYLLLRSLGYRDVRVLDDAWRGPARHRASTTGA